MLTSTEQSLASRTTYNADVIFEQRNSATPIIANRVAIFKDETRV